MPGRDCCSDPDCNGDGHDHDFRPRSRQVYNRYDFRFRNAPSFEVNPSRRFLGAEIEVAVGFKTEEARAEFEVHMTRWRQLLHGDCAFEACTSPANGDMWVQQINETIERLVKGGCQMDEGTGCHVHIDTRDFTLPQLMSLGALYTRVHNVLFGIVDFYRGKVGYCADNYEDIRGAIRSGPQTIQDFRKWATTDCKGCALNFETGDYNTVECRMLEGTMDADKIVNWGILWASMADWAKEQSHEKILKLEYDAMELLYAISPTRAHRRWLVSSYRGQKYEVPVLGRTRVKLKKELV